MVHGAHPDDEGHMLYDDGAFLVFCVAFLAVVWLPWAVARGVRRARRALAPPPGAVERARGEWCASRACQARRAEADARARPRFGVRAADLAFVALGALLAVGVVHVYRAGLEAEKPFDPFEILGVGADATPAEIKKSYRKLAVVWHPDKNLGDPVGAEKEFIRVSKAYAALTDEAAFENYRKYGNPDGYVGTTLGVGLPSFVEKNNNAMLFMYLALLFTFPVVVFSWWRRQSRMLPTAVSHETFLLYRETMAQTQMFKDLLGALGGSYEFSDLFKSEVADAVPEMVASLRRAGKDDLRRVKFVKEPEPFQVLNLLVLSCHLARIDVPPAVRYVRDALLHRIELHLTALADTVGVFQRPDCQHAWPDTFMHGQTVFLQTCITMSQCIIQAVEKTDSPLLQIPFFTDQEVRYCTGSRATPARTVYEFMRLDPAVQRSLLRSFSDDQFLDVQAFCDVYPLAMLTLDDPKVEDEQDPAVHAKDSVTVRAKLTVMRKSGSVFSPHTPNLPNKKPEVWWVTLADQRLRCPLEVKRLLPKDANGHDPNPKRKPSGDACCGGISNAPADEKKEDSCGDSMAALAKDPRVTVYEMVFRFTAPRPGTYTLELTASVDCYVGCTKSKTVRMDVKEPVEVDTTGNQRYFDTDDESDYDPDASTDDEESEDEAEGDGDGAETDPDDASYEYIEVTASESEDDFAEEDAERRKLTQHESDSEDEIQPRSPAANGNGTHATNGNRRPRRGR